VLDETGLIIQVLDLLVEREVQVVADKHQIVVQMDQEVYQIKHLILVGYLMVMREV